MQVDPDIGVEATIKRGLLPHMDGCKQDEYCTIFQIPRGYERHDSSITTLFRICHLQYILKHAPRPSNSKSRGKRPHGHGDNENLFKDERVTLLTLDGEAFQDSPTPGKGGRTTVMWTYPAKVYDYSSQNTKGHAKPGYPALDPGPFRIVTNRDMEVLGMIYHPIFSDTLFLRASDCTTTTS